MEANIGLSLADRAKLHGMAFVLREGRRAATHERVLRRRVRFHVKPAELSAENPLERGEGVVEVCGHARNYKQATRRYLREYAAAVTNWKLFFW